jgi:nicotinate-nucleotide adenylyltransferase
MFGGTFDPIHLGHLLLAEIARESLALERVVFVPARIPPHKGSVPTPAEHRFRMAELATRDNPHFEVSDLELRRDGPSYTVETLRELRELSPRPTELYLLMGADSARDLRSWKDHRTLLEEATLVVLPRRGVAPEELPEEVAARATLLASPLIEISSSEIRRLVRERRSIRYRVPESVEQYIRSEGLYRS